MLPLKLNPVFVIGSPRSGTSLFRLLLGNHKNIVIPPEGGFIIWLLQKYGSINSNDISSERFISDFIYDVQSCKKMYTWEMNSELLQNFLKTLALSNYAELCMAIYAFYAKKFEKNTLLWGDKNNFYLNHLQELYSLYPEARFIHIVRDGRDIACSYREVMQIKSSSRFAPILPIDIKDIATGWTGNAKKIDAFFGELPVERKFSIKYEDLVAIPEITLSNICEFLDLNTDKNMVNFHIENKRLALEPKDTLDWKKRTLSPISEATVGRYKTELSLNEINIFNEFSIETLEKYQYFR